MNDAKCFPVSGTDLEVVLMSCMYQVLLLTGSSGWAAMHPIWAACQGIGQSSSNLMTEYAPCIQAQHRPDKQVGPSISLSRKLDNQAAT